MTISGIQKFSLLDYPGQASCIIFTAGCNFRCGYCHNPEFVLPELLVKIKPSFITEAAVMNFLKQRIGLLTGVVITGGEPTVMADLPRFMAAVKDLGFSLKLDTNGNNPVMLKTILDEGLVDYVAMDIKTTLDRYIDLAGPCVDPDGIAESIALVSQRAPNYEFRSTLIKEVHPPAVLEGMAKLIAGSKNWFLQTFRPQHTLDGRFNAYHPYSQAELLAIMPALERHVPNVSIR